MDTRPIDLTDQDVADLILACFARITDLERQLAGHDGPHRLREPLARTRALLNRISGL